MKRILIGLALVVCASHAWAQGAVSQMQAATKGHLAMYVGTGIIRDAGGPQTLNGAPPNSKLIGTLPSGIAFVNSGQGLAFYSGYTTAPYSQMLLGFDGAGNGRLTLNNTGGAQVSFTCEVNGVANSLCLQGGLAAGLPTLPGSSGGIGYVSVSVSRDGTKAGLLGECQNSVDTFTECPGVAGFGQVPAGHAGVVFGVTGLGELLNPVGTVIGAEFSARNVGGLPPDGGLPPTILIPGVVPNAIGLISSCQWNGVGDTAGDCSLGMSISNNTYDVTKPRYLTAMNLSYYKNQGLVISGETADGAISLISKNTGGNTNVLLASTGTYMPATVVVQHRIASNAATWQIQEDGLFAGATHSWALIAGGMRPGISACGGGTPTVNTSNDEAMIVTAGTGTVTSCTLTFANVFAGPPACVAQLEDPTDRVYVSAKALNQIIVSSVAAANIAGKSFDVLCRDAR